MNWLEVLRRVPAWLLSIALLLFAIVFWFSSQTSRCVTFVGVGFGDCTPSSKLANALPAGAVVAFDLQQCPPPWEEVEDYKGRVIIGAGRGGDRTERRYRVPGGKEKHQLSIEEMPRHDHLTALAWAGPSQIFGNSIQPTPGIGGYNPKVDTLLNTSKEGGGKEFDTMPPFLPLPLCILKK